MKIFVVRLINTTRRVDQGFELQCWPWTLVRKMEECVVFRQVIREEDKLKRLSG